MKTNSRKCYPDQGGCWYCYTTDDDDGWLFSWEFDTNLHLECLVKQAQLYNSNDLYEDTYFSRDQELDIFLDEFKEILNK